MKKSTKILTFTVAFICIIGLCAVLFFNFGQKPTLESIGIKGSIQTQYTINEELNLNDAKLILTYSDDTQKEIDITSNMITGFDTTTVGNKTLTITYNGKTAKVNYVVSELLVSAISIKSSFSTDYLIGENLDISGGELLVTYSNGSTKVISIDSSMITNFNTSTIGQKQLTLTYKSKEIKIKYTVHIKYGEYYLQKDSSGSEYEYLNTNGLIIINDDFTGMVISPKDRNSSIFNDSNREYSNLTWKFVNDSIHLTASVNGQTKTAILTVQGDKLSVTNGTVVELYAFYG